MIVPDADMTQRILETAARLRASGLPECLNRWADMTPEQLRQNEETLERYRKALHRGPTVRWKEDPMKTGPKEQATRALREADSHQPAASAPDNPATAEAAQTTESAMSTSATKTKAKGKPAKKTSARRIAPKKGAARSAARTPADGGIRPGSKLEAIVGLLKRKEGCTAADVLQVTGWPSVSMPQQAAAAGIKLRTEKEGRVTRYWAAD